MPMNFNTLIAMTAINKITAAKLFGLINLPAFLFIAGFYQIASSVIV
tara:strand:+ start:1046 stop:1186 length:141 start_codon:yes stop_codon:yes gene_type:complete